MGERVELTMSKDMSGAEMVIEALADQGVEHLFGYPGGAVLPIYDALFQQKKAQHILVRRGDGDLAPRRPRARASLRLSRRSGAADLRRAVPAEEGPAHPGAARAGRR